MLKLPPLYERISDVSHDACPLCAADGIRQILLDEENVDDLKKGASTRFRTKERSKPLISNYVGVDKKGDLIFTTTSGTTPGKKWAQKIHLIDLPKALALLEDDPDMKDKDVVNLALFGDLKVWCNDPSFKYWAWKYISYKKGWGIEPETRAPTKRNVEEEGTICKHLYKVLLILPFHIGEITRDLVKGGFIETPYAERKPKS